MKNLTATYSNPEWTFEQAIEEPHVPSHMPCLITTEHAASSYGIPVVVDKDGGIVPPTVIYVDRVPMDDDTDRLYWVTESHPGWRESLEMQGYDVR